MKQPPVRIQRKRTRGWKTPANTVYVGRPSKFGNPWTLESYWNAGYSGDAKVAAGHCVDMYRAWMTQTKAQFDGQVPTAFWNDMRKTESVIPVPDITALRGKNLMCWCPLDHPCHADVLLKLANKPEQHMPITNEQLAERCGNDASRLGCVGATEVNCTIDKADVNEWCNYCLLGEASIRLMQAKDDRAAWVEVSKLLKFGIEDPWVLLGAIQSMVKQQGKSK